jgi:hypothetical protein
MSINGVSASTLNGDRSASADGVDDIGVADGPQDLPENETFGVAMVIQGTDTTAGTSFIDVGNANSQLRVLDSNGGKLFLNIAESGNTLRVESTQSVMDGTVHLIVINKTKASDAAGINFYIDDMSQQAGKNVLINNSFSPSGYSIAGSIAFFAQPNSTDFKAFDAAFFEFNSDPYSQQDRLDLKQRAPGL